MQLFRQVDLLQCHWGSWKFAIVHRNLATGKVLDGHLEAFENGWLFMARSAKTSFVHIGVLFPRTYQIDLFPVLLVLIVFS